MRACFVYYKGDEDSLSLNLALYELFLVNFIGSKYVFCDTENNSKPIFHFSGELPMTSSSNKFLKDQKVVSV